ncbi:IgGFc-binding protein-like [Saccostrea cucullata]|uniref:IgGFc-binding protein-like n=1 Tax=Saccostrea cuccullata TaxID=36930 RepID=UPI002ED49A6D
MEKQILQALLVGLCYVFVYSVDPPDNIGKEYVLMFMENYKLEKNRNFPLELYISTSEKTIAHVNIKSPISSNPYVDQNITVQPGMVQRVNISEAFRVLGNSISSKGLLIKSDQNIAVYGANKDTLSNDVYCAIPVDALGTEYYAACYGPALKKTELGVAATEHSTSVTVTLPTRNKTLSVNYGGKIYKAGDSITIKLDKYQTLQLQSNSDLTGAHIVCNKPVAAFSGNIKTNIGVGITADHLVEQLTPVDTWGKRFVTAPIPKRTTGDYFRIIAAEDNTEIQISGMPKVKIEKAGEWKQVTIPSEDHKLITSNKPIMLTQYVTSQQNDSEPADPSMMIIPPYELFGAKYTFSTPQYSRPDYGAGYAYDHEFIVIVKDTDRKTLLLDDKPFPSNTHWKPIPGTDLVGGYVTLTSGSHTVRNTDPTALIGGYLYGHAFHESYGFPTGMRLAKINAVS